MREQFAPTRRAGRRRRCSTRSRSCPAACSAGAPGSYAVDAGRPARPASAPLARGRAGRRAARSARRASAIAPALRRTLAGLTGEIEAVARRRRRRSTAARRTGRAAAPGARPARRRTGVERARRVRRGCTHRVGGARLRGRRGRLLAGAPGALRRRFAGAVLAELRAAAGRARARPVRRRRAVHRARSADAVGPTGRVVGVESIAQAVADARGQPGRPAVGRGPARPGRRRDHRSLQLRRRPGSGRARPAAGRRRRAT